MGTKEIELYVSAPGLILHSPSAVSMLEAGRDYTSDLELRRGAIGDALKRGALVVLSTGSPGLDYTVEVSLGSPDIARATRARAEARFPLVVSDGQLCLRDGYVTTDWGNEQYALRQIEVPDGRYQVVALWLPDERYGHMHICLALHPSSEELTDCRGWVELDYADD